MLYLFVDLLKACNKILLLYTFRHVKDVHVPEALRICNSNRKCKGVVSLPPDDRYSYVPCILCNHMEVILTFLSV